MEVRKLILVPEYRPLFALEKCWGPKTGPLTKPTPVPVDLIGQLLMQTGNDAVSIYEVKPDPKDPKNMLPPVRLTLDNYRLPYEEIAQIGAELPKTIMESDGPEYMPVEPTVVPSSEPDDTENKEETEVENEISSDVNLGFQLESVEPRGEAVESGEADPEQLTPIDESEVPTAPADPYAGMTKAERKRARREAAMAAAAAGESKTEET